MTGYSFKEWNTSEIMKSQLSISGLDFQNDYISISQFSSQSQAIEQVAILPLDHSEKEQYWDCVCGELKNVRKKFQFPGKNVICSLPADNAIIKKVGIDWEEEDVEDVFKWELAQQIISGIDDYAFDYNSLQNQGAKNFLIAAMRKTALERLSGAVKTIKLNPAIIDIDLFALVNVFEANYPEELTQPKVLIHGESDITKIILTISGSFIDYSILVHNIEAMEPAQYAKRLYEESVRILSQNKFDDFIATAKLFLSGSLFSEQSYRSSVLQSLRGSELLDPFRKIDCGLELEQEMLKNYAAQLAVSVGLALRGNQDIL
ncbi:pilus assembly protein PilM [Chitinispirillales bacterium ANBcel5]|uniref:type IV pilus biogenesis protein PilM n=1 Tax=Cellulosispirillum alkaliphilum TaxID=3039283 RepID=UPI002A4FB4E1|nr:pilus assembly protein PilM [Chitinispirillales bacterium ANBcel5]